MEEDELLDLVGADDQVVGTVFREEHHENTERYNKKEQYFRGTSCFLVNSQKQLWIPRRQLSRKVAPGGLDFSMAEHVQSGESHIEAAVRGMKEELNLNVEQKDLIPLGKKVIEDFGCVMSLYVYKTDDDPDYSKEDYETAWWMSLDEFEAKLKSSVPYKAALPYWISVMSEWLKNE